MANHYSFKSKHCHDITLTHRLVYLLRDLYQNNIRLWRHNYTALPKNLVKMWVKILRLFLHWDHKIKA